MKALSVMYTGKERPIRLIGDDMSNDKARRVLLDEVGTAKKQLISELESGYRSWKFQRDLLKDYQEFLKASDILAGYDEQAQGGG